MTDRSFETGRYLYCVVRCPETEGSAFSTTGVDGEDVYLIRTETIGIVVHECETLYDTSDVDVVRKWLLEHQNVIDAAGDRFGTPIPFQFDTILRGDDERVRAWLDRERETFASQLEEMTECWEYRVEVRRDEATVEETLRDDERLVELNEQIAESSAGTSHLLERQYEQRLETLKHQQRADRTAALIEQLEPIARDLHDLGHERTTLEMEPDTDDEMTRETRLALLVHEEQQHDIDDLLDDVAADPGVKIRYTGPWPPYTFAPTIEANDTEP
ncbi:gas vesicle protein GvpL [Halocatena pleomorpha]|uniref:GvpL/GvpF family gas vesicle protein n=1 Tax=Halocatena pleomorpha TaxID=1785090 RepID=A0A3P3RF45_9EURY|nr:GvpL/GvpF family gas vesicle protein [Halocatena pleomorpha]RRJ31559.1 GvpL/GvpF family gas vesicle protein [Halocatena pleomorpha]